VYHAVKKKDDGIRSGNFFIYRKLNILSDLQSEGKNIMVSVSFASGISDLFFAPKRAKKEDLPD
jgi:hypothetical protein